MSAPEREVKEPTVTKAPPPGRKFPCPKCGAKLDFDPSAHALACPYCGHTVAIERGNHDLKEHDLDAYLKDRASAKTALPDHASQVTCTGCGAVVMLEDKVATDRCPYCSTHLENKPEAAEAMIQPEGVLPFKVDERSAVEAFTRWIAGLWFAPNALRQLSNLGQLTGVYVPFWTFDSMTYTHYTGERGDDYWDTETYTETDASGNTVTRTRQVVRTRWTAVAGEVRHFFDDVLVCASKGLPEAYRGMVTPRELKGLEEFRAEFLSGFKTERYQVGPRDGFRQAQQIMDGTIRQLCCQDIGGNHQRLHSVQTRHVGVTFKHILLPVWLANYRYQNQSYSVIVNGRTGQILGHRPYSWAKITLLVLGIILAILLAVLIFSSVARGATTPPIFPGSFLTSPRGRSILTVANPTSPGWGAVEGQRLQGEALVPICPPCGPGLDSAGVSIDGDSFRVPTLPAAAQRAPPAGRQSGHLSPLSGRDAGALGVGGRPRRAGRRAHAAAGPDHGAAAPRHHRARPAARRFI